MDLKISGGTVTAEGASSGMSAGSSPSSASFTGGTIKAIGSGVTGMPGMASGIAFDTVEIGNGITSLTADGDFCAIGGTTITIGSDLMIKEPENGKVAEQSGAYFVMKEDGTTIATHALIVPKEAATDTTPTPGNPTAVPPATQLPYMDDTDPDNGGQNNHSGKQWHFPKTGDTADLRLWAGMVLIGLGAVCGAVMIGRRKKTQK